MTPEESGRKTDLPTPEQVRAVGVTMKGLGASADRVTEAIRRLRSADERIRSGRRQYQPLDG